MRARPGMAEHFRPGATPTAAMFDVDHGELGLITTVIRPATSSLNPRRHS